MRSSRRRLIRASAATAAALACGTAVALALPGDLDRGFDGDGRRVIAGDGADRGAAVAIQPDGRIVVAGGGGPDTALTVTRLNADGSLDGTLDGDGTRRIDLGGDETANAVAVGADGRIVVAGSTSIGANVLVARLNVTAPPTRPSARAACASSTTAAPTPPRPSRSRATARSCSAGPAAGAPR